MNVTFCGHREVFNIEKVKSWLVENIEVLVKNGADTFYLGGYGIFDKLAADVIWELKYKYPNIKSYLVLPYINKKYDISKYDDTIYPDLEKIPMRYAIIHRNRYMVNESQVVIAYVLHSWGGAAQTLEYAKKKNKRIILYENLQ